jgi:hypothetical protein
MNNRQMFEELMGLLKAIFYWLCAAVGLLVALLITGCGNDHDPECVEVPAGLVSSNVPPATCPPLSTSTTLGWNSTTTTTLHDHCKHWWCDD